MEITVLGCGDAFGSGGRLQTSFFIQTAESKVLLDCGATVLPALKRYNISSADIDTIVITHFHGDHYGGLPYLLLEAAKLHKRKKALTIISPGGLKKRLEKLLPLLYPGSSDVLEAFPIEYKSLQQQEIQERDIKVVAWEVDHSAESLPHGVRLEAGGRILAFSGDTCWHQNLIALSKEADLFICECNMWRGEVPGHLSWEVLKKHLPELSAKKIKLTHVGEEVLEHKNELSLDILNDGDRLQL